MEARKPDGNAALLICFNVLLFIFGAAIIAFGLWFYFDRFNDEPGVITMIKHLPLELIFTALLLAGGALVILIAFIGCCSAACCKNKCCLAIYAAIMLFLILVAVAVLVFAFFFRANGAIPGLNVKLLADIKTDYKVPENKNATSDLYSQGVDKIQRHFQCCGSEKPQDYENSRFWNSSKGVNKVPQSCCDLKFGNGDNSTNTPSEYTPERAYAECVQEYPGGGIRLRFEGCNEALRTWLDQRSGMVIGVAIAFVGCCVFGFILACCVCSNLRKGKSV